MKQVNEDEVDLSGRELDAAIARMLGHTDLCTHSQRTDDYGPFCAESCEGFIVPHYSTEIAAAMLVVEWMRIGGWSFACTLYEEMLPYASFCRRTAASSRNAEASTLSEAICLAALKAADTTKLI